MSGCHVTMTTVTTANATATILDDQDKPIGNHHCFFFRG